MISIHTAKRNTLSLIVWMSVSLACVSSLSGEAEILLPDFQNSLKVSENNPPTETSTSAVFFSGSVGVYAVPGSGDAVVVPEAEDTGITLEESSIGQYLARDVPYSNFADTLILQAQSLLYPAPGQTREQIEGSDAAFRYKPLLYSNDGGGAIGIDFDQISGWFGEAERSRAQDAFVILKNALKMDPLNRTVRNTLLDAYYDLVVAEVQYVKQNLASLSEWRLGFQVVPPGGFIIDQEIQVMNTVLDQYRNAMSAYGALLNDRMGRNIMDIDSNAPEGLPLGAYVFREEQPFRNQMAVGFVDDDEIFKTVPDYNPETEETTLNSDARILFSGYKDYVFVASLLRDYVQNAAELATFYGMRGRVDNETDDRQSGLDLIAEAQQQAFLTRLVIQGLFPDFEPDPGDASGLSSTLNGIDVALGDLSHAQSFLVGVSNVLGFDPDFLVLIQEFPDSTEGNQFDSYDAMIRWIRSTGTSPLTFASTTYDRAFDSYTSYKGHADQVANELSGLESTYNDRYFEITGYTPDEPGMHVAEPRDGSELWEVGRSIDQANATAGILDELDAQVEADLIDANTGVTTAGNRMTTILDAKSTYQGFIRTNRDTITHWNAVQAGSQAAYDTISDVSAVAAADTWGVRSAVGAGVTGVAGAINTGIQIGGEINKGNAERDLDLAAVDFETAVDLADAELAEQQAMADRNSLRREQISNSLQYADTQALLSQELARKASILREFERIRSIQSQNLALLQGRHYADPIHFLRNQNDMIQADNAFREAQRWLFYTVRALEFKWNKDFIIEWLSKDWEVSSLFKLRNYRELEEMVGAIEEFNRINLVGFNREPFVDQISLRDDILVPALGDGPDDGMRFDLVENEVVTKEELFRRLVERNKDMDGNIVIRLNTFSLRKDDGFFFLGPEYRSDGSVLSAGKYLDKIDWFKVNAVTSEAPSVKTATLNYGGTCYVRNRVPPCLVGEVALELPNEYRKFPFRYFFTLDNGATWETRTNQQDTVKLVLSPTSGEPEKGIIDSTLENNFLKERSVATSDIELTIPAGNLDISQLDDIEIYIRHLYASRDLPDCN